MEGFLFDAVLLELETTLDERTGNNSWMASSKEVSAGVAFATHLHTLLAAQCGGLVLAAGAAHMAPLARPILLALCVARCAVGTAAALPLLQLQQLLQARTAARASVLGGARLGMPA